MAADGACTAKSDAGYRLLSPEEPTTGDVEGLRAGLRERGYIEGRNIRFEYRWAQGKFERLSDLAAELVGLNVDVIVTYVTQASLDAKKHTTTIPTLMSRVSPPSGILPTRHSRRSS